MAALNRPSYAAYWRALHDEQDWEKLGRHVRHMYSQPVNWKANPGGDAGNAFNRYLLLRLWSGGDTPELAAYCLEVAKAQAAQAEALNGFADTDQPGAYPANRFEFVRDKLFIDAFASAQPLQRNMVLELASIQQQLSKTYTDRQWDAYPQSEYVHVIEMLLLVDEYDRAHAMLENARALRGLHVRELVAADRSLCAARGPVRDDALCEGYRATFDLLRAPDYADSKRGHPSFVWQQLVMACIWQKFFEPGGGKYDWDEAVRLIGA